MSMTKGGRNIFILGVLSVAISIVLASVSLVLYHNSGDVYLDRSRPGFLPDEEEIEDNSKIEKSDFEFSDSGNVSAEIIDEYLENLLKEIEQLDKFENPFDAKALTDETLGIPTE